jgi:oligoribonuclease NrnB/cAMP/cGMP phosphodiesterase (DHH superfamily)
MKTINVNAMENSFNLKTSKIGVVFHSIDFDGFTSAAIVKMMADDNDVEIKLIPWKHGDECPDSSDLNCIFVVDLTLPMEWMIENQEKIIWFDHHEAAIRSLREQGFKPLIDGSEVGIGACQLLANNVESLKNNKFINLVSTYDVFRKDGEYASWNDAWNFQLYLGKQYNTRQLDPLECVEIAEELIKKDMNYINFLIGMGECMEEKRTADEAVLFKTADECNSIKDGCKLVSDAIPSMAIRNHLEAGTNSVFFMRRTNPLDNGLYLVSIRVPETSSFNATEFAKNYNGGGHIKASGCSMTLEQWEAL